MFNKYYTHWFLCINKKIERSMKWIYYYYTFRSRCPTRNVCEPKKTKQAGWMVNTIKNKLYVHFYLDQTFMYIYFIIIIMHIIPHSLTVNQPSLRSCVVRAILLFEWKTSVIWSLSLLLQSIWSASSCELVGLLVWLSNLVEECE